jgi:PAS domain S-box-containing protein
MKISPLPINEEERLMTLRAYQVLDTEPESDFDGLVELASQLCEVPIALITLIDEHRQWFKSKIGLDVDETSRDLAFCAHTIHENDLMVVNDTLEDERFFDNPFVIGEPTIRFYAGMPLITKNGYKLGSLCVIDKKPRQLNERQMADLRILGKQVINLLDLRLMNLELRNKVQQKTAELNDVFNKITDAVVILDKNWCYTYLNTKAELIVSKPHGYLIGKNIWAEFPESVGQPFHTLSIKAMETQQNQSIEVYYPPIDCWLENRIYPSPETVSFFIRDITKRKKAEVLMVESQKNLERAEEQANLGSWYLLPDTGDGHWSSQMFRLLGFDPAKGVPIFEDYLEHIHPEDRHIVKEALSNMMNGETPETNVYRTNPARTKFRYLRPTARIIKGEAQNIIRFEGTLIDVTDQKKGEEALRESNANYRSIFENAFEGMYQSTPEGKFITANPALAKILGYDSPEDLINSISDITTELYADAQQRLHIKKLLVAEGKSLGHEIRVLKKNKEIIWVRDNMRAVYDENGEGKYFEGTLEDITQRKIAEEKLTRSENKLRAFFRSTPDSSILIGKNFEILAFNEAGYQFNKNTHGTELQEGDIFTDLILAELRPEITEYLHKALLGETTQGEYLVPNIKTGEKIWWLAVFMPAYDSDGNIFGVVVNLTNIDQTKRAEIKLKKQFDELQKTNHELDRFVYSVSHDLRAPLSSILGLINVAEMENPPPVFSNYLSLIRNSVNRLDGFIKDILDYSRNSRLDVRIEKIDLNAMIRDIQNNFRMIPGADRLKTEMKIADGPEFFSDPMRIGMLLNNLLSNAIKYQDYTKEESTVYIQVITSASDTWIKILDNGIGIKKEHLAKIFDMFYRASEHSYGSGLGLYIAKETVNKLGGTIKVESEFRSHTEFEIVIPNMDNQVSK